MSQPSHHKVNHDIEYLKQDQIGLVISKGLAVLYQEKPKNPVDYLAKWLLNYASIEKKAAELAEAKHKREDLREKHTAKLNTQEKERIQQENELKEHYSKLITFEKKIEQSDDLTEHLSGFANVLKEFNNATGVYIGKLKHVKKPIEESDFDNAHIEKGAEKVITYIAATPDHEYIIGKTLERNKGVTYDIFKEKEPAEDGGAVPEGSGAGNETANEEPKEEVLKSVYIDEVVREPRMKYFRVPKLGSYYAVLMTYNCCQYSDSLDEAFKDTLEYQEKKEKQDRAKKLKEEEAEKDRADREKDGVPPEQDETTEVEELKEPEFKTKPKELFICLDTMGQDREFTEEEKKFVMQWAKKFRDRWEESERQNVLNDVMKRIRDHRSDNDFIEADEIKFREEEDKEADAFLAELGELSEEDKEFETQRAKFKFYQRVLQDQATLNQILSFKQLKVIKFQRIFQSVFYLLGYKRDDICRPNTNKLFWKKAKQLLNDSFMKKLAEYDPIGPKAQEFSKYQLNSFLAQNIEGIEEEAVKEYSVALERLFKWLKYAIYVRKGDVTRRRAHKETLRENRKAAIATNEEIQTKRENYLNEKKQEYEKIQSDNANANVDGGEDVEIEPFNEEQVLAEFDQIPENQPVEVIPEVVDDIDNDVE